MHSLHHFVLLGTGQPNKAFFIAFIANPLDLLKKLRGFLYFINENRRLIGLEEQHRVALRQFSCHRIVHRNIGSVAVG